MPKKTTIEVNIARQRLQLFAAGVLQKTYSISTASNGAGELAGSECTPRGKHIVAAKIGGGLPPAAVLVGRRATGEMCNNALIEACQKQGQARDWILSRILWLQGLQAGVNSGYDADGKMVDSMTRYIYIHGTPDSEPMGVPRSHGCVRMRNSDIIELFEQVPAGTVVDIKEA